MNVDGKKNMNMEEEMSVRESGKKKMTGVKRGSFTENAQHRKVIY